MKVFIDGIHYISDIVEKGTEFVQTITSGKDTDENISKKLATCSECPKVEKKDGDKWYCKACSCPAWSMSELHTKLTFRGTVCPLGRFGMFDKLMSVATTNEMRSFITLVKRMLDSGLIKPQEAGSGVSKTPSDWNDAKADTVGVKVLSVEFLNNANQKMSEALKTENFESGFLAAIQIFMFFRP